MHRWLFLRSDAKAAGEIADALRRLQAIYQDDLRKSIGGRRTKQADLLNASIAEQLRASYGVRLRDAMLATTGKPYHHEADSLAAVHKHRLHKAQQTGVVATPAMVLAAAARLPGNVMPKARTSTYYRVNLHPPELVRADLDAGRHGRPKDA